MNNTITISITEYKQLVASQTLLEAIISSKSENGYYSDAIIKAADTLMAGEIATAVRELEKMPLDDCAIPIF